MVMYITRSRHLCSSPVCITPCGLSFACLWNELERNAVVAIALPGGRRAVIEEVPVVATTPDAMIFGARIDQLVIDGGAEYFGNGSEEARPAGAAVELHRGS